MPRIAPTRYIVFLSKIYDPLKIPLKSFMPKIIATIDRPILRMINNRIKNRKKVNFVNSSIALIGCRILKPKGFPGTRRKKAMFDNRARIPVTRDS